MSKKDKEMGEEENGKEEVENAKDSRKRPSRATAKKKIDYSEFEDDFESDLSDDYGISEGDDCSSVDGDESEIEFVSEEGKKSTKRSSKSVKKSVKTKKNKSEVDSEDCKVGDENFDGENEDNETDDDDDLDDLDDEFGDSRGTKKSSKRTEKSSNNKKKPVAPKNLTKRNVVINNGQGGNLSEVIFNYMKEQNRPYSIQNVVDNLHNVYSKKQVTDEMDRLTLEGKFICKEYGKQKVYLFEQSEYKELNKEEMEELDKQISRYESELNDLEAKLKQLKQETRNISVLLPTEVLDEKIICETRKNEELMSEIESKEKLLGDNCEVVPIEQIKELKSELQRNIMKIKKYKSICKTVLDTFSESMERKTADLIEEIGIEMM